jgi:phosphoribosylaminoimidazole-succinocarboxamide synthase
LKLIRRGKVKDIYELENGHLLLHFSDRISAYDVKMATMVPQKGKILCRFAKFWFEYLDFPNHMISVPREDIMEVQKLNIVPLEFVVRGYLYGSLFERFKRSNNTGGLFDDSFKPVKAAKLPHPILDTSTKSELHDLPITKAQILEAKLLTTREFEFLEQESILLYKKMNSLAEKAKFIIADVKFEFGRDSDNKIILADSIGPDEFRLWLMSNYIPGHEQISYDKQILRDWLKSSGRLQQIQNNLLKHDSLVVPSEIIEEITRRYNFAFNEISGHAT